MAGFYGNITNTSKIQFVFDKTYQNRKQMEENMMSDNVFIGRYVLVDYDFNFPGKDYTRLYIKNNKFYFSSNCEDSTRALMDPEEDYYVKDESGNYIKDENGFKKINPKKIGEDSADQEIQNYTLFNEEPVYVWDDSKNLEIFYQANRVEDDKYPEFVKIDTPQGEVSGDGGNYHNNYLIDQAKYGDIGRGWDSTVWQKVYAEDKEKYVMIAELNSVVPTFGVTMDPPTLDPMTPHFDADSSSLYYRLHLQPNWGFKVANYEKLSDADKKKYNSDIRVNQRGLIYNKEAKGLSFADDNYQGVIYYNKDGFDSNYRTEKKSTIDEVSIKATGKSGITYPNIHNGISNPQQFVDTQEIYINLPSIGNTISEAWDILYGKGQESTLQNGEYKKFKRNKTIAWDTYGGERLIKENEDGYEFLPEKVETVAGAINSIHDLMGMIIIEDDGSLEAEKALADYIYYRPKEKTSNEKGFYIKDLSYTIDDSKQEQTVEKVSNLKNFKDGKYYYQKKNDYYLAKEYQSGTEYLTLTNIQNQKLLDEEYYPNTYFYKSSDKYVLDINTEPADGRKYYKIEGEFSPDTPTIDHNFTYFYPSNKIYYQNAFESRQRFDNEDNGTGNAGLFVHTDNDVYLLFDFDRYSQGEYTSYYDQSLYWWENFRYEYTSDAIGNKEITSYIKNTGTRIKLKTVEFKEKTYFYYKNDEKEEYYEFLEALENADIEKTYYKFKQQSAPIQITGNINGTEIWFYTPEKYHYIENGNYVFAVENYKAKDTYYLLNQNKSSAVPVTDIFYESNKYYYKNFNDEYVLDTNETMQNNREYYNIYDLYIKDGAGIFNEGEKWNINIDKKPDKVVLGIKKEKYQWKELVGFARKLNTIHGLILDLNHLLKHSDNLTRDTSTVQGCINQLNDIINKFDSLVPNQIAVINQYGKFTSTKPQGDDWINIIVDNGNINLNHKDPSGGNINNETKIPKFGENFEFLQYSFDNKGHKNGQAEYTVAIPSISVNSSDPPEIDNIANTYDKLVTAIKFDNDAGKLDYTLDSLGNIIIEQKDDNKINLTTKLSGIVSTISSVNSKLTTVEQNYKDADETIKSTITDIQTKQSAQDVNIANAQSTAEQGVANAETAQVTAETAQVTAETAQVTAETAQVTAETAQVTANKANTSIEELTKQIASLNETIADLTSRIIALEQASSSGGEEEITPEGENITE